MRLALSKDLTPLKNEAKAKIDADAESIRGMFITLGSGQAMVYEQKRTEALTYLADNNVDPSTIPHIVSEAQLDQTSLLDKANQIIAMSDQWRTVSAQIEVMRLRAKDAVTSATTPAEIVAAYGVDWSPIAALAPASS